MRATNVIVVFSLVFLSTAHGNLFSCYDNVQCVAGNALTYDQARCTAEWGAFPRASHFKEWKYNRPGFASYFSKLSDDNWDEAISLMLHMVERGGSLGRDFKIEMPGPGDATTSYQLKEIEALSKALDKERRTATKTLHLAHLANHGQGVPHDAEFADFLAERLHKNSVLRIKHLANYVKLLSDIVTDSNVDSAYALFKFDTEYLK
ncbi:Ferritin heavy chain [Orchesella cincta]|uniref:Ferritin heavy chain n=1 Tax=Orchesella cincta TaxID=48709 RepID=A0A1D2NJ61_ORCCI|nr:Ferritin heavy chain [Orchesella cincta]